ncbi:hypothetical protein CRM22_008798 [Opisthorchis felineus]|uniref:Uncharacterized protein n=1 Tax=Opisthorchis felineus TaxID=147828 RepID=A0A4S2LBG7_OPIFE|nr:hypothetical protein CRM22_008798 [Opisthorchis felineus]TGZ59926.1 hypothetical protein CRM22_008798 [Opisthorchis felineus]
MWDGLSTISILSTVVLIAAREQCFVNWQGSERAFVICEEYCCGNATHQYCCSDCLSSINKNRVCEQLLIVIGVVVLLVGSLVICLVLATCSHWDSVSKWADHYCSRQRRCQVTPSGNETHRIRAGMDGTSFPGPVPLPFGFPRLPSYDECSSLSPPPPFTVAAPIITPVVSSAERTQQVEDHQTQQQQPDACTGLSTPQTTEGMSNQAYEDDSTAHLSYPPPSYELSVASPTHEHEQQSTIEEHQ